MHCDMLEVELSDDLPLFYALPEGMRGEILSVTPMEFVCASHNSFITLLTDDGQVRSFEIGRECALQYSGASAGDSLCCGKEGLGLEPSQSIIVRYCPDDSWSDEKTISISSQTIIHKRTRAELFCTIWI